MVAHNTEDRTCLQRISILNRRTNQRQPLRFRRVDEKGSYSWKETAAVAKVTDDNEIVLKCQDKEVTTGEIKDPTLILI